MGWRGLRERRPRPVHGEPDGRATRIHQDRDGGRRTMDYSVRREVPAECHALHRLLPCRGMEHGRTRQGAARGVAHRAGESAGARQEQQGTSEKGRRPCRRARGCPQGSERNQGLDLCSRQSAGEPDGEPAAQAGDDPEPRQPALPQLSAQGRPAAPVEDDGCRRSRARAPQVGSMGEALPHPGVRGAPAQDHAPQGPHPEHHPRAGQQRQSGIDEQQNQADYPACVRLPKHPEHD